MCKTPSVLGNEQTQLGQCFVLGLQWPCSAVRNVHECSLHPLFGVCVHVFVKVLLQKQEGSPSCTALEHAAVIMAQ